MWCSDHWWTTGITWDLVRNADSQGPFQYFWVRTFGGGARQSVFNTFSRGFWYMLKSEIHCSIISSLFLPYKSHVPLVKYFQSLNKDLILCKREFISQIWINMWSTQIVLIFSLCRASGPAWLYLSVSRPSHIRLVLCAVSPSPADQTLSQAWGQGL